MRMSKIKIGRILVLKSRKKLAKLGVNLAWTLLGNQFVKVEAVYPAIINDKQSYLVMVGDLPVVWKLNCFKGF